MTPEKIEAVSQHIYAEQGIRGKYILNDTDFKLIEKTLTIDAYGTCKAGIDYDGQPAGIEQDGTSVKITISPPQVFPCGITDVEYDKKGGGPFGIFGFSEEQHNELHRYAYERIQREAEQGQLLAKARANALSEIELNARKLGMDQVSVVFAKDGASDSL